MAPAGFKHKFHRYNMIVLNVIGFLGSDPREFSHQDKGGINFSLAHSETWTDQTGQKQSKTTWIECTYWTPPAGLLPYLKKGSRIHVTGAPGSKTYTDKAGQNQSTLTLKVREIVLIDSKKEE